MKRKRVMVAPLDWGLGHATRCIPIINELLKRDCEVFIASSGDALQLLRKEFPAATFVELVPYKVFYSRQFPLVLAMIAQLPKFVGVLYQEHKQLNKSIDQFAIDLVISDNRYGCWTKKVPCIIITHQLTILMPPSLRWLQPMVRLGNHYLIKRFNVCWVPDLKGSPLSGKLSDAPQLKFKSIGILSRMKQSVSQSKSVNSISTLVVILSGPEPQRTLLESGILPQLKKWTGKSIVVQGKVEPEIKSVDNGDCTIYNFLTSSTLESIMNEADLVIARSGYSTIMDLAKLGKKAILIPTPGQTEQEYLAKKIQKEHICFSMSQNRFDLIFAIKQSEQYSGFSIIESSDKLLNEALEEALVI